MSIIMTAMIMAVIFVSLLSVLLLGGISLFLPVLVISLLAIILIFAPVRETQTL